MMQFSDIQLLREFFALFINILFPLFGSEVITYDADARLQLR